jgi:hypothetical protein
VAPRAVLALALVLAGTLSACGPSREEERMNEVRRICEGFVPGTTTLGEASAALGGGQFAPGLDCGTYSDTGHASDVCAYEEPVCQLDLTFYQGDMSACAQTPSGPGCYYGCGLRAGDADWSVNQWDATLCARFFYGPQLTPLIPF